MGKNLLPRSKFFPLRVDPILKGLHCPGKHRKSQKLFPFIKMEENQDGAHIHIKVLQLSKGDHSAEEKLAFFFPFKGKS